MIELLVRDQSVGMPPSEVSLLSVPTDRISVREMIRSRVYQEVQDTNQRRVKGSNATFKPSEQELALNGARSISRINWQTEYDRAVQAFEKNHLVVLVDDRQAESLNEQFDIVHSKSLVTFLRLLPLVGG